MSFEFVPAVWGSEGQILHYELVLIKQLQAPTQQSSQHLKSIHVDRQRAWPRLRSKPTLHKEIALNLVHHFFQPNVDHHTYVGDGRHCENFAHLRRWCRQRLGIGRELIIMTMYSASFASWLSIFLGERCTRLDYNMVWQSSDPLHLVLAAWHIGLSFDYVRRMRVQRKVYRFIGTSYRLSIQRCILRVPTHSMAVMRQVEVIVRRPLVDVRRQH